MPETENADLPESSRPLFRSSPRADAMVARLRYVGEHVFGGNLAAYADAVGLTEHWLRRILSSTTRVRVSTFIKFVESGVVAAEWLFCGTGPMVNRPDRQDELVGYTPPTTPNTRYPIFDPMALEPGLPKKPKKVACLVPNKKLIGTCAVLARAIFDARTAYRPVVIFLGQSSVKAGIAPIVLELIRKKYITGIALTGPAAVIDYAAAKKDPADISDLAEVVKTSAAHGIGLGEGIGRWGFLPTDKRERSILAAAYDFSVPATVHTTIGDSAFHLCPALYGIEFGAALGSTSYVDAMVFTAQIHAMSGAKRSLFIASGDADQAMRLFWSACEAGARLSTPLRFPNLLIACADKYKSDSSTGLTVTGDYVDVFSSILTACNAVYEGVVDEYVSKTGKRDKRKPNRRVK